MKAWTIIIAYHVLRVCIVLAALVHLLGATAPQFLSRSELGLGEPEANSYQRPVGIRGDTRGAQLGAAGATSTLQDRSSSSQERLTPSRDAGTSQPDQHDESTTVKSPKVQTMSTKKPGVVSPSTICASGSTSSTTTTRSTSTTGETPREPDRSRREVNMQISETKRRRRPKDIRAKITPVSTGTVSFSYLSRVAVDLDAAVVFVDLSLDSLQNDLVKIRKFIMTQYDLKTNLTGHQHQKTHKAGYKNTLIRYGQRDHWISVLSRFEAELEDFEYELSLINYLRKSNIEGPLRSPKKIPPKPKSPPRLKRSAEIPLRPLTLVRPIDLTQTEYNDAIQFYNTTNLSEYKLEDQLRMLTKETRTITRQKRSPVVAIKALILIVKGALLIASLKSHASTLRSYISRKDSHTYVKKLDTPDVMKACTSTTEPDYLVKVIEAYQRKRQQPTARYTYNNNQEFISGTVVRSLLQAYDSWSTYYFRTMRARLNAIKDAYRGRVSPYLFKPKAVFKALTAINNDKEDRYSLAFSNIAKDLPSFYKLDCGILSTGTVAKYAFTIGVIVPLINQQQLYSLYKFRSLPIPIQNPDLELTHDTTANFLVMSNSRTLHLSMTADDLAECSQLGVYRVCPSVTMLMKTDDCLSSLFKGLPRRATQLCDYKIRRKMGTAVMQLGDSTFMISTSDRKVLYLVCPEGGSSLLVTPGQSKIVIPADCSLDSDEVHILPNSNFSRHDVTKTLAFETHAGQNILTLLTERYPTLKLNSTGLEMISDFLTGTNHRYTLDNLLLHRLRRTNSMVSHKVSQSLGLGVMLSGILLLTVAIYLCITLRGLHWILSGSARAVDVIRGEVLAWWRREEHPPTYVTVRPRSNRVSLRLRDSGAYHSCDDGISPPPPINASQQEL